MVTKLRIFRTARPSLVLAAVLPMDPAEQATLDEIRRRRALGSLPGTAAKAGPGHDIQHKEAC